jgi:N-acetylglucosaminyl-diphospho-decaprenol L-rhamnosyltransferase
MSEIGIIIVTYNSGAEIGECLDAAVKTGADIIVVDNGSHDRSVAEARLRNVRVVANLTNVGFAAAVNQGFERLQTPYVVLLNPDAVIESTLQALRAACDLPQSAGAGGALVDARGKPQIGFMVRNLPTPAALILEALVLNRMWPSNPVNRRYRGLDLSYSARLAVEQPAGAFLMIRRNVWSELGGFDEGFHPLWFEDVDFCRRVLDRGYRLYFEPAAVAKHTGAHSIPQIAVEIRRYYWYRSLLRYSAKHFHGPVFRVICLAVISGSILRTIVESVQQMDLKPIAANGNVVRLAAGCLLFGWREGADSCRSVLE